jgi:hypothetical protein
MPILVTEIVKGDATLLMRANADLASIGKLSIETLEAIYKVHEASVEKFCHVCSMTDFPEMADHFRANYKKVRFFWTHNHIAREFSTYLFHRLIGKLFGMQIPASVMKKMDHDIFSQGHTTPLCEYDFGYEWNEPVVRLSKSLCE